MPPDAKRRNVRVLSGNEMCVEGALAAGCRFFGGYPITPSSEVAEGMSLRLPALGGTFIQMEDEMAGLACAIGASLTGRKAMTATSGPGYSLMQEHIGYAAMAEIPVVILNVQRGGPSTGLPTLPSQADVMQAKWGSHGDYPAVALTPSSVAECFPVMVRAFEIAERLRTPVTVLTDEVIGHMREDVEASVFEGGKVVERLRPEARPEAYQHYDYTLTPEGIAMADFGQGYRFHVTGLAHRLDGFPTNEAEEIERCNRRILRKVEARLSELEWNETAHLDGAEILVVSFGISGRVARAAVERERAKGAPVGFFRPITLWPFPEATLMEVARGIKAVVCVEMNAGQVAGEIRKSLDPNVPVIQVNRLDGKIIEVDEVRQAIEKGC
ncbi:MAG: 2-oxoacid:acceptor oxidoreductase subunit alpha [Planctomycetota bacterium]|jgi:2-oxoglutarate ferredoxin oxidoreductase subunit alpha